MSWASRCMQAVSVCLVCTEAYDTAQRRPKLLRCGHTFCLSCLGEIARLSATNSAEQPSSLAPRSRRGVLSCPKCRVGTPLPDSQHGVTHLLDNYAIVEFITGDHSTAKPDGHCAKHPHEQKKYFCMSCYRLLCPCCACEHVSQTPWHCVQGVASAAAHFRVRLHAALDYCRQRQDLLDRVLRDSAAERRQISALCLSLELLMGGGVHDVELLSQKHTLIGLQEPESDPDLSPAKTPKPSTPHQLSL